jgi:hypothetical protein
MDLYGRVFDGNGVAQSPTTAHQLNQNAATSQWRPITRPNYTMGGWAIGFSRGPAGSDSAICLNDEDGNLLAGDTSLMPSGSHNNNGDPAIATNDTGHAIVVWRCDSGVSLKPDATKDIEFRLLSAVNGALIGPRQYFANGPVGSDNEVRICSGGSNNNTFWAAWHFTPGDFESGMEVGGEIWAAILRPNTLVNNVQVIKDPFRVSAVGSGRAVNPEVAVDGSGRAVFTWWELVGSWYVVKARAFNADGSPRGVEWQVSPAGATIHYVYPDVSIKTDGTRVVFSYNSSSTPAMTNPGNVPPGHAQIYARVYD